MSNEETNKGETEIIKELCIPVALIYHLKAIQIFEFLKSHVDEYKDLKSIEELIEHLKLVK